MQKRLVAQGNATLTLSLPSKWIKTNNLGKGDEVNLELENNDIIIRTTPQNSVEKITIDTKEIPYDKQTLMALTHLGYDEIVIVNVDSRVNNLVDQKIGECVGYEIVEQTTERIVVKNLSSGPLESEFNTIMRKIFLTTKNVSEQLLEYVENQKLTEAKSLISIENNNNKFIDFF